MKKKPYTLVVIDMQADFYAANDQYTRNKVMYLIERAMSNKMPVVVVEYNYHSPSHREIYETLEGYHNFHIVIKNNDGGHRELIQKIGEESLPIKLKVCGVNLGACVYRTVTGLVELGYFDIEVFEDACNHYKDWDEDDGQLEKIKYKMKKKNIKVNDKVLPSSRYYANSIYA